MQGVLRGSDTIARMGGDEFVLLLPDYPAGSLSTALIQRIMDAVCAPVSAAGNELLISCSMGIAVYPADGEAADMLVEHGDTRGVAADVARDGCKIACDEPQQRRLA